MPSGGLQIFGSGLRLQAVTPGVKDQGNANINGVMIATSFDTRNAATVGSENTYLGSQKTFGLTASQGTVAVGNFQKIGGPGGYTPQFATVLGSSSNVYCEVGTAIGNAATAGVDRGNVGQSNSHTAVGYSTVASGDPADFANFSNTCVGSSSSANGRRTHTFGASIQTGGTGHQDVILIGTNISTSGANNLTNCLIVRSASSTKVIVPATDSNSIIIGEPTQTRVLIGPYTITSGIAAVGFLGTANATVANTVAETTIFGAGVGTLTIPAGRLTVGSTIRLRIRGVIGDTGTPTLQVRFKLNATTFIDTGATALTTLIGTHGFEYTAEMTVRTAGAGGTAIGNHILMVSSTLAPDLDSINTATTAIDTTIAQVLNVTVQWGTANALNTITQTNVTMEILG